MTPKYHSLVASYDFDFGSVITDRLQKLIYVKNFKWIFIT